MNHYIYLLREREFIKTNEQIFKIGKTTQEELGRFKNYPKGSELILHVKCEDCHLLEKRLIELFRNKYVQKKNIGLEYFEGNYVNMIDDIISTVIQKQDQHDKCTECGEITIVKNGICEDCDFENDSCRANSSTS